MATGKRALSRFLYGLVMLAAGWPVGSGAQTGALAPPAPLTLPKAEQDVAPGSEWRTDDRGELTLDDLQRGRSHSRRGGQPVINELRAEALKETALRYGARAGLYTRTREINQLLDRKARQLDPVFLFAPLMLHGNILPPVVQYGLDVVKLEPGHRQLRLVDALYVLVSPARWALTPPDWRTYLYLPVVRPEPPDESLLPDREVAAEVALWEDYVARGWQAGVQQANRGFEVQLNRLERDLKGMALYRELLAKDMVTAPQLSREFLGITGDAATLAINDQILRIEVNPRFVRDNSRWKPYPRHPYAPSRAPANLKITVVVDRSVDVEASVAPSNRAVSSRSPTGWGQR